MFRILGQTQETAGVRTYRLTPAAYFISHQAVPPRSAT